MRLLVKEQAAAAEVALVASGVSGQLLLCMPELMEHLRSGLVAGLERDVLGRDGASDVVSMERLVYLRGRRAAIEALGLTPGARVLDVGCGTGLNFPNLAASVGPAGQVVGVDARRSMLRLARQPVSKQRWARVTVVEGDAARLGALVADEF